MKQNFKTKRLFLFVRSRQIRKVEACALCLSKSFEKIVRKHSERLCHRLRKMFLSLG